MGHANNQDRFCSTPKLPLFSYPINRAYETPGLATPPVNIAGSIPFLWEEAPGKPRVTKPPRSSQSQNRENRGVVRCLPSPTTVLDGPYDLRRRSLSLPRSASVIRTLRGVPPPEPEPAPAPGKGKRLFGSSRWGSFGKCREVSEGRFDFLRSRDGGCDCRRDWAGGGGGGDFAGDGGTKVKLFKIKRKGSLFHTTTKSDFWARVYEGFRQVIPPWKHPRKQQNLETI